MAFPSPLLARLRNTIWEAGLLSILPLAFWRGFSEQFTTPKLFLAKVLLTSGLAVWGIGQLWRPHFPHHRLHVPLLAFSLALLISALNSPARAFSLQQAEFALCGPVWIGLLLAWEKGEQAVLRIFILTAVSGAVVALVGLCQLAGYDPALLGGYRIDWGTMVARMRVYATFGNPNFVAGYLIGAIFPALALAASARAKWVRIVCAILASAMALVILATGSRGAWFGLAAGLAVAFAIIRATDRPLSTVPRPATFFCVSPPATWLAAAFAIGLAERLALQLAGRVYLWRFSFPMFWEHPVLGSGWGSYQLLYLEYQARFLAAHGELIERWTNNRLLHNDLLQMLLEIGLLGCAAFAWILWEYVRRVRRVLRPGTSTLVRCRVAASVGGLTAILADSLFNFQFAVPPTFILVFTFLAIPFLLSDGTPDAEVAPSNRTSEGRSARLRAMRVAGTIALVVAASLLLWQLACELDSEHASETASIAEQSEDWPGAEAAYRYSISRNSLNGRAHFGLGRVCYRTERLPQALTEVTQAEKTYADSHEEVLRGRILDEMGRRDEALAAYRHALWLDPTLATVQDDIERLRGPHK